MSGKEIKRRKKFSYWSTFQAEITEAFWTLDGIKGVMGVTGLNKTQAYVLAEKLGLIEQSAARKKNDAVARRAAEKRVKMKKYLRMAWGWNPGHESVTLRNGKVYRTEFGFKSGRAHFPAGQEFIQYTIPSGKVYEYLISHGVKYWVAGDRRIPVEKTSGRWASLSLKLDNEKGG